MIFELAINCDNDAFSDLQYELPRILQHVTRLVRQGDLKLSRGDTAVSQTLFDINGNDVGYASFYRDEKARRPL